MSFDEKLIEEVKKHEVIYNLKDKNYRKVDLKDKIWKKIGDELNESDEKCRRRWKGLRDTYKKIKKESELPSGSAATKGTIWKHFENMKFLNSFESCKETIGNVRTLDSDNIFSCDESPEMLRGPEDTPVEAIQVEYQSTPGTSQSNQRKKKPKPADPIQQKFLDLINTVQSTVTNTISSRSSTHQIFEVLATKVDESDLTIEEKCKLEAEVSKLVYDTILYRN